MCEASACVDARAADGSTALLVACEAGHLAVAQCLASYLAIRDPLILGCLPWSSTAEEAAKRRGDVQLVQWLNVTSGRVPPYKPPEPPEAAAAKRKPPSKGR